MYKAMIKKSKNKKGFTLVELIVVMAILAILAAILIPSVSGMINRSNQAVDNATARNLYMAATMAAAQGLSNNVYDPSTKVTTMQPVIDFMGNNTAPKAKTGGTFNASIDATTKVVSVTITGGKAKGSWSPTSGAFDGWTN